MKINNQGVISISLLTAVLFISIIFIAGVYIGQEVRGFYRLRELTIGWAKIVAKEREAEVDKNINTFMDCIRADYPVLETYPPQCQTPDGRSFTSGVSNLEEKFDLIRLTSPKLYQKISSPLVIAGEARGTWFFEASFPVTLVDWDGRIIAESFIMTSDDWMTTDFVRFRGTLNFSKPDDLIYNNGSLILHKDNPSGLPEFDDALEIPIIFE